MGDVKLSDWLHFAVSGAMGIVALMISNQVNKLRIKTLEDERALKEWVAEHFVSKDACEEHRRGAR